MARTVGQFPRLIMIMFGVKGDLTTALGWYACIYFLGGAVGLCLCNLSGPVLCGEGKEIWNIRIPVHKACGAENHCSGEGDRFSSEPAGVRPVQRRVQLFHDRSSFGRSGSAGSGAFHNDGNVLYPASLFWPWVCCLPAFSNLIRPRYAPVRFSYWPPMCWPLLPSTQGIVSWII